MRWNKDIQEHWEIFVEAALQEWPEARESDLLALDGTRAGLARYLSDVTGKSPDLLLEEIAEWQSGTMPADIRMDEQLDNANISGSGRFVAPGEDVYDEDEAFGTAS